MKSSACAVRPMSSQEMHEKLASTLNVYDDNRVGFEANYLNGSSNLLAWTSDKNIILAIQIYGNAYNLKDVDSLRFSNAPGGYLAEVNFKSGKTLSETAHLGQFNVAWLACNTNKTCFAQVDITNSDYMNNLGGILTGMYVRGGGIPGNDAITDSRTIPVGNVFVGVLDEQRRASLTGELDIRQTESAAAGKENIRIAEERKQAQDKWKHDHGILTDEDIMRLKVCSQDPTKPICAKH